jgi:NADH-quinone oxidoreductase subunit L
MFFAAGVGAYGVAMFHLFTHAFFKALLFLGAGSVIHSMHHEQDMRYYGGLRKKIPFTFWAMMFGTLAITGVGIYHAKLGFAGFWSKDAIIEVAFARGTELGTFAFWMGVFAALLTSFYSWRLMFLTFWGKPRWIESEHIQHTVHKTPEEAGEDTTGGYEPHESPMSMLVPLGVLSLGAIFAGQAFAPSFLDDAAFWADSVFFNAPLLEAMHEVPYSVKYAALIVMVLGFVGAWFAYIKDTSIPGKFVEQFKYVHQFVFNKWYFDELYNFLFIRPAFWLGRKLWIIGDQGIIDRFGPNGAAWVVQKGTAAAKKVQSGYLNSYALMMLLGLVAAITWVLM